MKILTREVILAAAIALALGAGTVVLAQQPPTQGQGQEQGQQPAPPPAAGTQPGQPAVPAPPALDPEEENAYKVFYELKMSEDPQGLISSGEDFLQKFPTSRYRESVYTRLSQAYLATGDLDKMVATGEKGLEINPDNVDMLAVLSYGMLRRFNPDDLDAEQKLEKTEKYAKQCISLLNALPKPAAMSQEIFDQAKNEKLAMCNSGLGLSYFRRQRYGEAIVAFEDAIRLAATPDLGDLYLLGRLYEATQHYADAVTVFTKCSEAQWDWQDLCKEHAEKSKKLAALQTTPPKQ
jgi:tetratricopeptide (TPR) repeat protein